jgi:hypothetical protein
MSSTWSAPCAPRVTRSIRNRFRLRHFKYGISSSCLKKRSKKFF